MAMQSPLKVSKVNVTYKSEYQKESARSFARPFSRCTCGPREVGLSHDVAERKNEDFPVALLKVFCV